MQYSSECLEFAARRSTSQGAMLRSQALALMSEADKCEAAALRLNNLALALQSPGYQPTESEKTDILFSHIGRRLR